MNHRQKELLERLKKTGHLSIEGEAMGFKVSPMTIRRDLQMFEDTGLALRVHGGAVPKPEALDELTRVEKTSDEQKRIASKALSFLQPGTTIMLSVGETTLQIARLLALSGMNLNVVTNSMRIASALFKSNAQVLLTGGSLRNQSLDLVGPQAENNLSDYYIDLLITGCDGADSNVGFFTTDLNLANLERKSVEVSGKVLVVTTSAKFKHRSFVKFADISDVSLLITDNSLPESDQKNLTDAGVELVLV